MCTVSFHPLGKQFLLAMNRDEQRTRVKGIFPGRTRVDGVGVLGPSEPSGGRWIVVNEFGVCLALLNWYAQSMAPPDVPHSRGAVVGSAASVRHRKELLGRLDREPLVRVRPFRMVSVFSRDRELIEWRWDGERLHSIELPWQAMLWASSGYDEPAAQASRREVYDVWSRDSDWNVDRMRKFHASHEPEQGALSVCMHRVEAATVSYTEVSVGHEMVEVNYFSGAPCSPICHESGTLPLQIDV